MSTPIQSFGLAPQQAMLLAPGGRAVVAQCLVELGTAPVADVRRRLEDLVARHESLRTTFPVPSGARTAVAQAILDRGEVAWGTVTDEVSVPERLAALRAREAEAVEPDRGPSLRALLVEGGVAPALLLTAPAACADARSLALLGAALLDDPRASASAGIEAAEPIQPADYAAWRQELREAEDGEGEQGRSFWAALSETAEPLDLLGAAAGGPAGTPGEAVAIGLTEQELDGLRRAAEQARVAPELVLEACWLALLARVTGAEALLTVHVGDGRALEDLADAIGPYAQPLPVQVAAAPDTRFRELLDRLSRALAQAERWQNHASERDLERLAVRAVAGFTATPPAPAHGVRPLTAPPSGCALELAWLRGESLELRFDAARLQRRDAEDLAAGLHELVRGVLADASKPLAELPIVDESLAAELLACADGGPAPAAEPVHVAFARHAAAGPERPSVVAAGRELTYGELAVRARAVAARLRGLGVAAEEPVGLCLRRSPELLAGLLGVLEVGGAYLPLNPGHPPARLAHQLAEAGARVVLTEAGLRDRFEDAEIVCLDAEHGEADGAVGEEPGVRGELAYVMYTSGSTGTPKGVAVTHANLAAYTAALCARLELPEGLHFASVSDLSTDLGNTATFPALATGGCVHLIDSDTAMDGEALSEYVAAHPIDVLKITPTHLRALLGTGSAFLPRRWLIVGGEALDWELAARAQAAAPAGCRLLNHYGPTETTVGCCTYEIPSSADPAPASATVPIGRPLAGARAYVLDERLAPLPFGVTGELFVGGAGVARGYVGRPVETAERFLADPRGGRMYRTGDRVRRDRQGRLEFRGRGDQQLKIRGFRVEPGEIESVLVRHPAVSGAAVVPHAGGDGELRLVAYFVATEPPAQAELQTFLEQSLPDYMVPSRWVHVPALPLTASGKVDRLALPDPDTVAAERAQSFVAPRDELEAEIAAIWAELLGLPEVGVQDDFFALGGHSLLATQAIMRIRRRYGGLPLGALFSSPTVAALAEVIRARGEG